MKSKKSVLAIAVCAAMGTAGVMAVPATASAAQVIANGTYNMVVNTTPVATTYSGTSFFKFGKDGAYNSSFTFGGGAPSATSSQGMTDNGTTVASAGGTKGSGIAGDGYAGILGIDVTGSTFSVVGVSSMGGTINQSTGAMTFNPTGTLGAISGKPTLYDEAWNINVGGTAYNDFTTGNATSATGTVVTGTPFTAITGGYNGTLVSGGSVGSAWGPGFAGVGYFEIWNVDLLATATPHSGYNMDSILNTAGGTFAQYTASAAPVPIPAAAWLFGSGLIGLVGIARRKKSS